MVWNTNKGGKGYEFEKWVVARTNRRYWHMVEWQGDKFHNGRFPESNRNPDMLFRVKVDGQEESVALECKWRKGYYDDGINWASEEQIDLYNRFQRERSAKVFVVIGVGGTPAQPSELYIAPLNAMKYPFAKREHLQAFHQSKSGRFYYDFNSGSLFLGSGSRSVRNDQF